MRIDLFQKNFLRVTFTFNKQNVDIIKKLPYRVFNKKDSSWVIPVIDLFILKKILKEEKIDPVITKEAYDRYIEMANEFKVIRDLGLLQDVEYETFGLHSNVKLYPFQKVSAKFLDKVENGLAALDMGAGKAEWIDSKLLTPNGWIKMGDIKINDFVFGQDGLPHKVVGVFPQGFKDCYEVEFTDGSTTTSVNEHLWNVQSPTQKLRKQGFKTKQLKEFKDDLYQKNGNTKWFIPMVKPIQFDKKELLIDPYILGALIGDGCLKKSVSFTSADNFIIEEFKKLLPSELIIKNKKDKKGIAYSITHKVNCKNIIRSEIINLKLNCNSESKFIPDIYKFSSIEQRIALLQGLMDTDGGVDTKRNGIVITYTSVSEKLIDDVRFIVESLGGIARKTSRIQTFTYKGIKKNGQRAYRIHINLPPEILPFRLPRKLDIYTPRSKYKPYRGFKKVTYLGKKECQCIAVDSPDNLYVTDHCIVTHNTIISIVHTCNLLNSKKIKQAFIICPASLKYSWGYEIAKFTDKSYTIVDGKQKERFKLYKKKTDFIIVNYDLLWRDIEFLKEMDWDLIIADEIQRIRNYKSNTFKCFLDLGKKCNRRIGLTGTPIENELMDLFTLMRFINPYIFGANPITFRDRYCTLDFFGRIDSSKYKNLDEINKKLSFVMIRRKKRDILKDLPEKIVNNYYITLNDQEKKQYNEIKEGILQDIKAGTIKNVEALAKITYLRQACDSLNLVLESQEKIVSSKLDELKNILKDLPEESKVIIFTQYERMAKIIEKHIGYKSVHLHGGLKNDCKLEQEAEKDVLKNVKGMSRSEIDIKVYEEKKKCICKNCPYYNSLEKCNSRKKVVQKFDNEKDVKLFISTDAGKAGLNLQVASVVINFDMSFNPATNEQRIARIDRIGQLSEKILVINLICYDTIEERVLKILDKKQKLFDRVIDGMTEEEVERIVFNSTNIKELL